MQNVTSNNNTCAGLMEPQRTFRRNYSMHVFYFCKALLNARSQSRFMPMPTIVIGIVFFHFSSQLVFLVLKLLNQ